MVLILLQLPRIGRKTVLKYLYNEDNLSAANIDDVKMLMEQMVRRGLRANHISDTDIQTAIERAQKIQENCNRLSIACVDYFDERYPKKLRDIDDPPVLLYVKGNIKALNDCDSVAIVGTRCPSDYGVKSAFQLGEYFGKRGYTVVSGLARGCDEYGHKGCLNVTGTTIAVLGNGLEKIYPAENAKLAQEILENGGCLVSEYPPYSQTFKNNFVDRDRIQSGLSDMVIVIETDVVGGTMHTVEYAKRYLRQCACIQHPVEYSLYDKTNGNKKLISEGAYAIHVDQDLSEMEKMIHNRSVSGTEQITMEDFIKKNTKEN